MRDITVYEEIGEESLYVNQPKRLIEFETSLTMKKTNKNNTFDEYEVSRFLTMP